MAVQQLGKKQAENEELELQRDKIKNMMERFLKPIPLKIPTGGFPKVRRKKFKEPVSGEKKTTTNKTDAPQCQACRGYKGDDNKWSKWGRCNGKCVNGEIYCSRHHKEMEKNGFLYEGDINTIEKPPKWHEPKKQKDFNNYITGPHAEENKKFWGM